MGCRKARRNYEILEKFEAGIELVGSEVKSCRMSKINMDEGFAQVEHHSTPVPVPWAHESPFECRVGCV